MTEAILGTQALTLPFSNLVPFLEKAGTLIAIRSGLCDMTESAKCLKIVLSKDTGRFRDYGTSLFELYKMKDNYNRPDMYDLVYTPRTEHALIEKIVNMAVEYAKCKQ
jgi:hypothetical protein